MICYRVQKLKILSIFVPDSHYEYNQAITMKRKLVFVTNNKHKLEEISAILEDKIDLLSFIERNGDKYAIAC